MYKTQGEEGYKVNVSVHAKQIKYLKTNASTGQRYFEFHR